MKALRQQHKAHWGARFVGATNPSEIAEGSGPPTEGQDAQPEEDAALDPMGQAGENLVALLPAEVC